MPEHEAKTTCGPRPVPDVATVLTAVLSFLSELERKEIVTRPLLARVRELARDVAAARAASVNHNLGIKGVKTGRELQLEHELAAAQAVAGDLGEEVKQLRPFERVMRELIAAEARPGHEFDEEELESAIARARELVAPKDGAHAAVSS